VCRHVNSVLKACRRLLDGKSGAHQQEARLTKYRRIEINAFRRRVTIVSGISGELPRDIFNAPPSETDDGVSLNDSDSCEPIEPDTAEGQLLIVEAVRSLERRLSPEARAALCAVKENPSANHLSRHPVRHQLQSFCQSIYPKALRFTRKDK
jgi:hypothetical protein